MPGNILLLYYSLDWLDNFEKFAQLLFPSIHRGEAQSNSVDLGCPTNCSRQITSRLDRDRGATVHRDEGFYDNPLVLILAILYKLI